MNISEVKELLSQFDGSSLREFTWQTAEGTLSFSKNGQAAAAVAPVLAMKQVEALPIQQQSLPVAEASTPMPVVSAPAVEAEGEPVTSPLVGVVYLKSGPDKPEFIKVGDTVKKGQTLLIIEAMKVMNEIPAPQDGVVTEILVKSDEVVEYGQKLVRLK